MRSGLRSLRSEMRSGDLRPSQPLRCSSQPLRCRRSGLRSCRCSGLLSCRDCSLPTGCYRSSHTRSGKNPSGSDGYVKHKINPDAV